MNSLTEVMNCSRTCVKFFNFLWTLWCTRAGGAEFMKSSWKFMNVFSDTINRSRTRVKFLNRSWPLLNQWRCHAEFLNFHERSHKVHEPLKDFAKTFATSWTFWINLCKVLELLVNLINFLNLLLSIRDPYRRTIISKIVLELKFVNFLEWRF